MLTVYYLTADNARSVAHQLLADAWAQHADGPMPPIWRDTNGKPYFSGNQLYFSLSHTKTMALCAVSDAPVGADCETVRPISPRVANRVLSPLELTQYRTAIDPQDAFFRFWTMKEAWVKYTGEGLHGFPKHTDFRLEIPGLPMPNAPTFHLFFDKDCQMAVCTPLSEPCRFQQWRP
jgi:phosphopantetheine--protein transferase-like protein